MPAGFDPAQYRMLAVGIAMVLIMRWRPRGLVTHARAFDLSQGEEGGVRRSRCARVTAEMAVVDNDPLLRVEHLTMRFGGLIAIGDLSFTAGRNDITALIGPNGAGKTTVFNCITGFYKPTEGMITLTHADGSRFLLERMDDFRIAQHAKVARTFQNIRLFAGMTVLENLVVAQHNTLMRASGFTLAGILGPWRLSPGREGGRRNGASTGSTRSA